jgi:hypothetical protein
VLCRIPYGVEVRVVKRFLVVAAIALGLWFGTGAPALAGTKWCVVDPIITVDGRSSDVQVGFAESFISTVAPPVLFRFHVPSNSTASVKLPPSPVAYTVELSYDLPPRAKRDPVLVTVETLIPASASFETQTIVHVSRNVSIAVSGTSNAFTTITYSVR